MKVKAISIIGILICAVVLAFTWNWNKESSAEFAKSEIDDEDYYSLVVKYEYIQGSKQGDDFQAKLRLLLDDGMISRGEFEKLTGDKTNLSVYVEPEKANLYKDAKAKLIVLNKKDI
mgnify:CR=1 FL=1